MSLKALVANLSYAPAATSITVKNADDEVLFTENCGTIDGMDGKEYTFRLEEDIVPEGQTDTILTIQAELAGDEIYLDNNVCQQRVWKIEKSEVEFVDTISVTALEFDRTELKLTEGSSDTLVLKITPANATDVITWRTSDPSIATIQTTAGGVTSKCEVTVQ